MCDYFSYRVEALVQITNVIIKCLFKTHAKPILKFNHRLYSTDDCMLSFKYHYRQNLQCRVFGKYDPIGRLNIFLESGYSTEAAN